MLSDVMAIWEEEKRIFPDYSIKFKTPHISYKNTDRQRNKIDYLTVRFEDTLSFTYSCLDGVDVANRDPVAEAKFFEKDIPENMDRLPSLVKNLIYHIEQTYGTNPEIIDWVKDYEAKSKAKKREIERD
jgi:hypothetical protein